MGKLILSLERDYGAGYKATKPSEMSEYDAVRMRAACELAPFDWTTKSIGGIEKVNDPHNYLGAMGSAKLFRDLTGRYYLIQDL